MASEVSICNIALTRLGDYTIGSLSEANKASRMCAIHYPETRDYLLRMHPWNFAVKRMALALQVATPAFEYGYQFALPDDCLKVLRTEAQSLGYTDDYRIEGRLLVCDDTAVSIEYIAQITDPNTMDALFRDALSARLAAELSLAMTDNATLAKELFEIAENKLRMAFTADAQEGTPRDHNSDVWLVARI